jgi:hypothetical protein
MKDHKQTWIKVNAPVDKLIRGLVSALNLFPKLQTIESCQGNGNSQSWVNFYYGEHWKHSWKELANFVLEYFGPGIVREVGDRVDVCIRVTESGQIFGELFVKHNAIPIVTKAIIKLHHEYDL